MRYILRACIVRDGADEYVDALIRACHYAKIDEIMMCESNVFIAAIPQPIEEHKKMAKILKSAVKKCKANGIRCSFFLKSLVGHFSACSYALPYTKFVGMNGQQSTSEPCLLDEDFASYAADVMSCYAECGFESMMFDDDFRSINHCNGQFGCFCDLHVQKTAERYGKSLTREQLITAFKRFDKESLRIKKCFREINFEGQIQFAQKVEKAVHAVDYDVQIGLMASGLEADQYQGRDIKKLLEAFAGEGRTPFIRPPGGAYSDTLGGGLFYGLDVGLQYRSKLGENVRYVSEIDVFSPRNIFKKGAKILDLQGCMHALAGFDELTLNVIDHYGTSPMESIEYLDVLKENKEKYAYLNSLTNGKTVWGIGIPLLDDYVEKLDESNRFNLLGQNEVSYYLHKMGLPVSHEQTEVNFLTGELLNCYSNEEFRSLLSKGVILDEQATRIAFERGFAEYIGVSYIGEITEPCFERFTNAQENGTHTGFCIPAYTANVHANEREYRLQAANGATVLTEYIGVNGEKLGDCTVYYENSLGGRVLVMGTRFIADKLFHKARRKQLHEVVKKLFKGTLPFDVENAVSIAPIWYKGEKEDTVVFYNFGLDAQTFQLTQKGVSQTVQMAPLSLESIFLGEGKNASK